MALLGLSACSGDGPSDPSNPDLLIAVAAGAGQTGTVGAALPSPVQVLITDLLNRPVPGKVVNFTVLAGGGSATNTTTTDANGIASASWQLGIVATAAQSLEARVLTPTGVRKTVTFSATAVADVPDTITAVAGSSALSAAAGHPVRVLPAVRLADRFGNPVSAHPVQFAVSQGGGAVQGANATTDSTGVATVGQWTMGPAEGSNSLTASVPGLSLSTAFQASGTSPIPSRIAVFVEPSGASVSGAVLPQQPVGQVVNTSNDPVYQAGTPVTLTLVENGASVVGAATVNTDAMGTAQFAGIAVAGLVGSYSFEVSAPGLAPDTTIVVAIAAGPATTIVANAGDNQSENAGTVLPTAPSVRVTDDWDNGVGGIQVTFTVGSGGGTITGGAQSTGPDGVATVGSWRLGPSSGPNSIIATAQPAGLSNSPVTFNATALGDFWSPRASMPVPRRFTAWGLLSNQLYTAGGRDGGLTVLDTVQVYNIGNDSWSGRRAMNNERVGASSGFIQGLFYVAGGNRQSGVPTTSVEVYNPANNSWAFVAALPTERNFSAFTVLNDKLYLAGGGNSSGQIRSTVVYDPVLNQWDSLADLPAERNDAVAVTLNGLIYLIGGQQLNTIDGAMMVYDPGTDVWTPLAPMPTPRYHANAEVLNGKIYVISGLTFGSVPSPVVEVYDPGTDTWSTAAPIPTPRSAAAIAVYEGVIYVVGGSANNTVTGVVEAYVP
jgi:hypothetical protein